MTEMNLCPTHDNGNVGFVPLYVGIVFGSQCI